VTISRSETGACGVHLTMLQVDVMTDSRTAGEVSDDEHSKGNR